MNKSLIRLEDLPPDIQEKIIHQLGIQEDREQITEAKQLREQNSGTKIVINNRNKYYITTNINALSNEGVINEKKDSFLDTLIKAMENAAKNIGKWLSEEAK